MSKALTNPYLNSTNDKAVKLSKESIIRPMTIGNSWTTMCIGVRWALGIAGVPTTGFKIHLGLVSASGGIATSSGNALFLSSTGNAWASASCGAYHNYAISDTRYAIGDLFKRENSTETSLATGIAGDQGGGYAYSTMFDVNNAYTGALFMIITKSTTWSVDVVMQIGGNLATHTRTNFLACLENQTSATGIRNFLGNTSWYKWSATGLSINEATYGNLTSLIAGCRGTTDTLVITDLHAAKWA